MTDSLSPSTPDSFSATEMGALIYPGGTRFRVWAPHADQVYVTGTFNDWSRSQTPMELEADGFWSANVPGAAPGDEYKFVLLNGDRELLRTDPYGRDVTSSVGNSIIHDPDFDWGSTPYQTPPWNEMVIYEMHIGTFNDDPGGPPGNLNRAIEKLTYLQELGINAIQLMPPTEFAGGFSWGYNPAHLFAIESDYGGITGFKQFVQAAHEHGIAVIFDVVYNHFGPSDLDLWQFDGWSQAGLGGIYFYNDWRSHTPWGDTRPDYGRPQVRQFIRDNAMMWLDECRVDGLRWDATAYIRHVYGSPTDTGRRIPDGWWLMQEINREIDARFPWKISIAEDLRDDSWMTREPSLGGAGFDAQWDGQFVHPIREAIISPDDAARDMNAVSDAIYHRYHHNAFERIIYTESHDEVANGKARVPEEIWHGNADSWYSKKRSTLGAALLFTSPGIPMIFQGQEFLEDEWFHDKDPIDWSKKDRFAGIWLMYRDLIRMRRNWHDVTRGLRGQHVNVFHANQRDKVIAYHRWENGGPRDDVIVVANMASASFASYDIGLPRPGTWRVRFNSDWRGYDPDFGDHPSFDTAAREVPRHSLPYSGRVGIGPYSVIVLSQDG